MVQRAGTTFGCIATKLLEKRAREGLSPGSVKRQKRLIEKDMALISDMPIEDISAPLLLASLRKLEGRGVVELTIGQGRLQAAHFDMRSRQAARPTILRRRAAKRRLPKRERVALYMPQLTATVRSVDFMSDALACGSRIRTFNVVDDFNREGLRIEVDTSMNSNRLVRVVDQLKRDHGLPQVLRSVNGPEFLDEPFTQLAEANGVALQYIQPGKPRRTPSSNASTGPSERKCSTCICSPASRTFARQLTGG